MRSLTASKLDPATNPSNRCRARNRRRPRAFRPPGRPPPWPTLHVQPRGPSMSPARPLRSPDASEGRHAADSRIRAARPCPGRSLAVTARESHAPTNRRRAPDGTRLPELENGRISRSGSGPEPCGGRRAGRGRSGRGPSRESARPRRRDSTRRTAAAARPAPCGPRTRPSVRCAVKGRPSASKPTARAEASTAAASRSTVPALSKASHRTRARRQPGKAPVAPGRAITGSAAAAASESSPVRRSSASGSAFPRNRRVACAAAGSAHATSA